jgi:polyhydroxyalkanoate synthesis regulator phasin
MGPLKGALTENQEKRYQELLKRKNGEGKPLTDKMENELKEIKIKRDAPLTLPDTCTSYLKEWYASTEYGDKRELHNKYVTKGNLMEDIAIELVEEMTGEFMIAKNEESFENEYSTGTPDIITEDLIRDTKCSWNSKTFLESVLAPLCDNYAWQMRGYMMLTGIGEARVCYCLVDTPEDANYGQSVSYENIPPEKRYHEKVVERDFLHESVSG